MGKDRGAAPTQGRPGLLILTGVISLILVIAVLSLQPAGTPLDWGIRAAGLLGYLVVFLAVISAAYMRRLFQLLGRPFVRIHHILAVTGLILVTLHPLGAAVRSGQISDFVPVFSPPREFLRLGGRPAWYLIGIAALAARMRKSLRPSWRTIHTANYLAFVLATAHAILNGTDFAWPVMKVVAGAMAVAAGTVFVSKRVQRRRLKRRK